MEMNKRLFRQVVEGVAGHDGDEHDGEDGDEVDGVHLLEVVEDAAGLLEERGDDDGAEGDDGAEDLSDDDNLAVRGGGVYLALVDVEAEEGAGAVEGGVEAGEDGAEEDGGEEALERAGRTALTRAP